MTREIEDRVVAMLEAVGGQLTRSGVYARFSDDFDDEADLAKALGRLVADGRLVRETRERCGEREYVYGAPGSPRVELIAAAAQKVHPAATKVVIAESPAPPAKDPPMTKRKSTGNSGERIKAFLESKHEWLAPHDIAEGVGLEVANTAYHLHKLATAAEIQATGARKSRRFAAVGVAIVNATTPQQDSAGASKHKRPTATKPARNLAEFGAQLPVAVSAEELEVSCAIEDSGIVAIAKGKAEVRLTPKQLRKVIRFVEHTQLIWMPFQ